MVSNNSKMSIKHPFIFLTQYCMFIPPPPPPPPHTHTHTHNTLQAFANYLAYKKDNNELLLFILKQLAGDHLTFNRNRYGGDLDIVEVPEQEFVEKVLVALLVCKATINRLLVSRPPPASSSTSRVPPIFQPGKTNAHAQVYKAVRDGAGTY